MLDPLDLKGLFRRRLRFTIKDDLTLFQLVKSYDPFQHREKWEDIQKHMHKSTGKPFILRTIKDRVTHLIKRYVTEDLKYNKANASPDQWKAKSRLLADVVNLRIQAVTRKCLTAKNKDEVAHKIDKSNTPSPPPVNDYILVKVESENEADEEDNHNDNDNTFNYIKDDNDDSFDEDDEKPLQQTKHKQPKTESEFATPPIRSTLSETAGVVTKTESLEALEYLTSRHQDELNLKNRYLEVKVKKVAVKEKELALEREQFELQRMERTQRLEVELKERELHMKVLEQQQQMIAMLLEQTRQG